MIESVLIANRGEIACRIQRTCQRLGIRSIAVYSDADANARHVREADHAVRIGPAEAIGSYLDPDAIIAAALASGAQAIHPGYGFLSEKTVLPRLCEQHGLVWVGPRADVIALMGSKIEAKRVAEAADVQTVPGYHGEEQAPSHLLERAREIGFPVLIKASAGGGGKGMRRVDEAEQFLDQLALARQEALRAFGDDRVLIEKLILRPRHLEVQLAGDRHGNLIHLFERECSIQRNYQKMIEEAPAAHLPPAVRARLFEQALRLGRQIGYDSLGTVEFVLEEGGDTPYFLEMNTRLQVEHPVTEQVVGLDLVELQLLIASGQPLPHAQADIGERGWAIEARINCEDPARDFQPQIGKVGAFRPAQGPGLRCDSGIDELSVITPYYDSMIAKIIGYGATRTQAASRLAQGLAQFHVEGVGTNQAALRDILALPAFHDAPLTTRYMAEQFPQGWRIDARRQRLAQCVAVWHLLADPRTAAGRIATPWESASGFRHGSSGGGGQTQVFVASDRDAGVMVRASRAGNAMRYAFDDEVLTLDIAPIASGALRILDLAAPDAAPQVYNVSAGPSSLEVGTQGIRWAMGAVPALAHLASQSSRADSGQDDCRAEIPGLITAVHVTPGQVVAAGEALIVMEAMKLIHTLHAEVSGQVSAVHCSAGDTVAAGKLLVEIDAQ